jgi:hypothetical protein
LHLRFKPRHPVSAFFLTTTFHQEISVTMSNQQQSPLFRLPRELRDNIYEHYAHDGEGVIYDYASDKLRYANKSKHEERNALTRCCKQAAEEMHGAVMRANRITFFPARSDKDGICFQEIDSRAGRFERLVQSTRRMKMHILHHVANAGCVTPAMVDQVAARFPGIACWYRAACRAVVNDELMACSYKDGGGTGRWQTSATFCEALQYTLELASSHPEVDSLAAEAFVGPWDSIQGTMPPFVVGSYKAVLAWNPPWWLIPTEADLVLESCLKDPFLRNSLGDVDSLEFDVPVLWFFSATAVAINFLRQLPQAERMRIREKIVIREDKRGAAYPESHLRGLAPFIGENPHVRFELHVGFWTNLMHPVWLESMLYEQGDPGSIHKLDALRPLADFLHEATTSFGSSPPTHALNIYIEGHLEESVSAWEMIKHAASLQEALEACDYMAQHQDIRLSEITVYQPLQGYEWHPGQRLECTAFDRRFQLPCDLPDTFYSTIREITEGSTFIHFDGDAGSPWDAAREKVAKRAWTPQQFADDWFRNMGLDGVLALPPGGVAAYMQKYKLQTLVWGEHPWTWTSPDGTETLEYYPTTIASDEVFPRNWGSLSRQDPSEDEQESEASSTTTTTTPVSLSTLAAEFLETHTQE